MLDALKEADKTFERHYEMRRPGYDLNTIEYCVCEIFKIDKEAIFPKSREKVRADTRSLFCFLAVRELDYGKTELARKLGMTYPGVG